MTFAKRARAVVLLVTAGVWSPLAAEPFDLALELEAFPDPALIDVPLTVRATIKNRGLEEVVVELGSYREQAFQFSLVDREGRRVEGDWRIRGGITGLSPRVHLPAGAEVSQELILNRWLSLDTPGSYELVARIEAPVHWGGEAPHYRYATRIGTFIKEVRLPLTLKEDPQAAGRYCAALATVARHRGTSLPAMEQLTFARSHACLPALVEVLSTARPPNQRLPGTIAEIGGRAAAEALARLVDEGVVERSPEVGPGILYHLEGLCEDYESLAHDALHRARGWGCP